MDKAIDTLEFLREYLENEVRPSCEYYIYSNLFDITDEALAELEAYKAKLESLRGYCQKEIEAHTHFIGKHDHAKVHVIIYEDILQKLEELDK